MTEKLAGMGSPVSKADRESEEPRDTEAEGVLRRDSRLLDRWREGDWDAGLELMRCYYRYFLSLCHGAGITGSEARTDLFHDLVLRVHRVLPKLRIEKSFSAYLRRVFVTSMRARRPVSGETISDQIEDRQGSPADATAKNEMLAAILDCTESLDERERWLFQSRYFDGRKMVDIAAQSGLQLPHLYVLYSRVRKKMVTCLDRKGFRP